MQRADPLCREASYRRLSQYGLAEATNAAKHLGLGGSRVARNAEFVEPLKLKLPAGTHLDSLDARGRYGLGAQEDTQEAPSRCRVACPLIEANKRSRSTFAACGIGGFFVNGEALRRGDFSRVLFNWDCY